MQTHTNTSGEVSLLILTVTREIKEANVCQTPIPRHPRNRVVLIVLPSLPLAVQWLVEEPWRSSQAKWLDVGGGGEGREVRKMSALMFSLAEDVQGSGFFCGPGQRGAAGTPSSHSVGSFGQRVPTEKHRNKS